jgi:peptide/nickel transport system permease protein
MIRRPVAILCGALVACSIVGAVWQPYDPSAIDLDHSLAAPDHVHWLGTDHLGRDLASRLLAGAGRTFEVAALALGFGVFIGGTFGLVAGSVGGPVGRILVDLMSLATVVPTLIIAIAATAIFGLTPGTAGLALAFSTTAQYGLITDGLMRAVVRERYWLAAQALGTSTYLRLRRHALPAILPQLSAHLGSEAARVVVSYSALAFIGLGADTSAPDWGSMVWEYRMFLFDAPLLVMAPMRTCLRRLLVRDRITRDGRASATKSTFIAGVFTSPLSTLCGTRSGQIAAATCRRSSSNPPSRSAFGSGKSRRGNDLRQRIPRIAAGPVRPPAR